MTIKNHWFLFAALSLGFALVVASAVFHPSTSVAGGQQITCTDLTRNGTAGTGTTTTNGCINNGTTTPVFLTSAAATTTLTVASANATTISVNLDAIASSTSSVLTWSMQYSYNGVDWYNEDTASTTGSITTHSGVAVVHSWTPGTTVESRRSMNLPTHGAKFTRIGFQATGANASLYAQAILQNSIVN